MLDFGKSIGTNYPFDKIEHIDGKGNSKVLHPFFRSRPNNWKTRGLLEMAKELQLKLPSKMKLQELQNLISDYPSFKRWGIPYFFGKLLNHNEFQSP